jgi:hypothetical protein
MTKKRRDQIDIECNAIGTLRDIFDKQKRELQIKILDKTASGLISADEALSELDKFEVSRSEIEDGFMMKFRLND